MSVNEAAKAEWRKATRAGVFLLGFSCFLSFFTNMLMLTTPMFMLLVYDRVLASRSDATLVSLLVISLLLIAIMGQLDFARRRILARFGAQFQERLERIITEIAFAKGARNTRNSSSVIATGDLDNVRSFLHSGSLVAIFDVIWAPMFLGLVFVFHSILGWTAVVGLFVLALVTLLKFNLTKSMDRQVKDASKDVNSLHSTLNASEDLVKSQRMFPAAQSRWLKARNERRDVTIALHDRLGWYDMMARQLLMIMRALMLALGAYLVLKGQLSIGAMIASVVLLARVFYPVEHFLRQIPKISGTRESWCKIQSAVMNAGKSAEPAFGIDSDSEETLKVDSLLVKGPGDRGAIVRGVSFEAKRGEISQIIGDTGCGKSVLSRALIGAFPFQGGRLSYAGRSLSRLTEEELGGLFGYVPERATFFPGTVADNISKMDPEVSKSGVLAAAKTARIHDIIETLPSSYETEIDLFGRPLSSGEGQRLALARALYGDPRILVIDEPGGMFDQGREAAALTKAIATFVEDGGSVIVLSAKPTLAKLDSKIFRLLDDGRFKADAPAKPLRAVKDDGSAKAVDPKWTDKPKPKVVTG